MGLILWQHMYHNVRIVSNSFNITTNDVQNVLFHSKNDMERKLKCVGYCFWLSMMKDNFLLHHKYTIYRDIPQDTTFQCKEKTLDHTILKSDLSNKLI